MIARCSKYDFWNLGTIWDRNGYSKKIWSIIFSSKKIRKRLVEFFWGTKKIRFLPEKFSMKKSMKIRNFENLILFRKNIEISKFWIFIDFFNELFFRTKSKLFGPKKNSTNNFRIFFSTKKCPSKFSDYLFRSQMIPRFRKSHLEQRATNLKIRTTRMK